jgi:hypothetical protein
MRTMLVAMLSGLFVIGCASYEPDRQTKLLAMLQMKPSSV